VPFGAVPFGADLQIPCNKVGSETRSDRSSSCPNQTFRQTVHYAAKEKIDQGDLRAYYFIFY